MPVEGNGSDAPMEGAALMYMPGIEGRISGHMSGELLHDGHQLAIERRRIALPTRSRK